MKTLRVYGEWELVVPDHVADWDVWSYWERARSESIRANLRHHDVLVDVGAEHGTLSALYALMTGCSMVLVEPGPMWPNIRQTFTASPGVRPPLRCFQGYASAYNSPDVQIETGPVPLLRRRMANWPESAYEPGEVAAMAYGRLEQDGGSHRAQCATVDTICQGLTVKGVTIDVEGAEVIVLQGMRRVLELNRPLVWVSIHADLMARDFPTSTPQDVHDFMADRGYRGRHLGTDHEQHWLFYDPTRPVCFDWKDR